MIRALNAITRDKRETYAEYIGRVQRNPLARQVKIADLKDNLTWSRGPVPEGLEKRYIKALRQLEAV